MPASRTATTSCGRPTAARTSAGPSRPSSPSGLSGRLRRPLVPELLLEHLAHRVARQLVDEAHLSGALVGSEEARHVVHELPRIGLFLSVLRRYPRHDALAQVVVGRPGHRDLGHGRMLEQRHLDLAGPDLVAAGLDQIGRATAHDAPVAVRGPGAQVAGEEPALADRLLVGVRSVEIAGEEVGAAHGYLAD